MRCRRWFPVLTLPFVFCLGCGTSASAPSASHGYRVGERISPNLTVLDAELRRVRLWDQVQPDARVVVLVLFGGAAATPPPGSFRGPLWCEDSFDDLAVQRALVRRFEGKAVQFLAVAVPPVYSPSRYGYAAHAFAGKGGGPDEERSPDIRRFVQATLELRASSLLPYRQIFFDPYLDLLRPPTGQGDTVESAPLKWHEDPRKYGVPTIWILDASGKVLREPFWGNEYDASPPQVRYGFENLAAALKKSLISDDTP